MREEKHLKSVEPGTAFIFIVEEFLQRMEEEKEEDWFNDTAQEPEVKKFTLVDLVRVIAILFVFVVYFFIFLKIMFLS